MLLRLARLPGEAASVARAVAVLGEGADLAPVAGVAGLDEAQVAGAMAALARAEILRPEPPPGFVHPLVRDAVYQSLPLGERELLHARAARVLRESGASLDQIAGQLMHAPKRGDADAARLLHEAGHGGVSPAAPSTTRSAISGARSRSRRRPRSGRRCCWTSARSRRSRAAPTAPATCARPTKASPTSPCASARRTRSAARSCSRSRPPRAPPSPARRRASCRPGWRTTPSG